MWNIARPIGVEVFHCLVKRNELDPSAAKFVECPGLGETPNGLSESVAAIDPTASSPRVPVAQVRGRNAGLSVPFLRPAT